MTTGERWDTEFACRFPGIRMRVAASRCPQGRWNAHDAFTAGAIAGDANGLLLPCTELPLDSTPLQGRKAGDARRSSAAEGARLRAGRAFRRAAARCRRSGLARAATPRGTRAAPTDVETPGPAPAGRPVPAAAGQDLSCTQRRGGRRQNVPPRS